MKKILIKCTALLLLVSCGGEPAEEVSAEFEETVNEVVVQEEPEIVNSYVLESKNVGIFSIGQEVPNLPDELKMRHFLEAERTDEGPGEELTHNVIFNQLEDVVELIMDHESDDAHHEDKDVEEMWVLSNYYKTTKEIGVGSTIEEFEAAYPGAEVWYTNVSGRYIIETSELQGVQFMLNGADCIKKPETITDQSKMKFEDFSVGAEVQKVRVY
jgi:hypothetical protein